MTSPLSVGLVVPEEALKAAEERGIVLPDVYYSGERQGIARALSFSIAGVTKLDQLQRVLDSLVDAMKGGATFDEWREKTLAEPEVGKFPVHRLDNIFRTNIQGAYARGRCLHIRKHKSTRPYLMYSAVNDSRTRPAHSALNGFVAAVDDPVWQKLSPPNGYRCRCTVISLTESQAKQRRDEDRERLEADADLAGARQRAMLNGPDAGWDYSPCGHAATGIEQSISQKKYHPKLGRRAGALLADLLKKLSRK
jgi:SPP1 gp7 family putative phage head morphogenesis protein